VVRPEGHQALDERPLRRHPFRQGSAAFGRGDLDERAPSLRTLLSIGPTESAERLRDRVGRCRVWSAHLRRRALELRVKPAARIACLTTLAGVRPEPESIQGAKYGIHENSVTLHLLGQA
jgi:hypothetical protein